MENDYSSVSRPAIRPRRSIGFRLVQIGLFFVLSLATVIAIFYAEENWRGYRGLKQYRAEQEAKGEVIDWQSIIPPAIPDDRNLAMTPLFQPLLDYERVGGKPEWRSDGEEAKAFKVINKGPRMPAAHEGRLIDLAGWERQLRHVSSTFDPQAKTTAASLLAEMKQFDPQFKELQQAIVSRPEGRWPVKYEENFGCLVPHLAVLKDIVLASVLRTAAHLELGRGQEAFEDLKVAAAVSDSVKTDPILITHLLRIAMTSFEVQAVREGLARRAWTDEQLQFLQDRFTRMNLLAEMKHGLRGERAFSVEAIEMARLGKFGPDLWGGPGTQSPRWAKASVLKFAPRGWYYQNELNVLRFHERYSLGAVDEKAQRVYPRVNADVEHSITNSETPYNALARMLVPAVETAISKSARSQSTVQQCAIACALERYFRAHKEYPDALQKLVPQFMAAVPNDVMDGEPMRYRREKSDSYLLYSVGWNVRDDGGVTASSGKGAINVMEGDWVWRLRGGQKTATVDE
jgi:hypothetical protein